MDSKQLLAEALQLPPEERAAIAGELIQSLDSHVDDDAEAAWSAEIRRRLEWLDSGLACFIHERVFPVQCAPSPCPSPPLGARGSEQPPLPRRGGGSGGGGRMCSRIIRPSEDRA